MDIITMLRVVRRHWVIMALGAVIGLVLMVGSSYQVVSGPNGPQVKKRSFTTYTVQSQLVVVDPQFWMGRGSGNGQSPDDFNKTVLLATTYANLLSSDVVRSSAEASVGPTQAELVSESVENAPIIRLTLTGTDRAQLERYGTALSGALSAYLTQQQSIRGIDAKDRMSVRQLSSPTTTTLQSRGWEISLITFLIPVLIAYGIALLIERARHPEEFAPVPIHDSRVV